MEFYSIQDLKKILKVGYLKAKEYMDFLIEERKKVNPNGYLLDNRIPKRFFHDMNPDIPPLEKTKKTPAEKTAERN